MFERERVVDHVKGRMDNLFVYQRINIITGARYVGTNGQTSRARCRNRIHLPRRREVEGEGVVDIVH
jgi:hypothetical protein